MATFALRRFLSRTKRIFIATLICLLPVSALGKTYYVSPHGDNSDGSSWTNAYTTIQAGINAAISSGDIVEIEGGTYRECVESASASVTIRGSSQASHDGELIPEFCT